MDSSKVLEVVVLEVDVEVLEVVLVEVVEDAGIRGTHAALGV